MPQMGVEFSPIGVRAGRELAWVIRRSYPARRSLQESRGSPPRRAAPRPPGRRRSIRPAVRAGRRHKADGGRVPVRARRRSEEHTSELQSLMRISYAVFCLKKKKKKHNDYKISTLK